MKILMGFFSGDILIPKGTEVEEVGLNLFQVIKVPSVGGIKTIEPGTLIGIPEIHRKKYVG